MKKTIIISTAVGVLCFVLGMSAGWHGHKSQSRAVYKLAILKGQLADSIISNNNVYDMDGSDQMASYLYVSARLDTLLAKQRALCLIFPLRHDLCTRGIIVHAIYLNALEGQQIALYAILLYTIYLWHLHSPLATNKHLLLTNDNQY